jgi:hypothetical protein
MEYNLQNIILVGIFWVVLLYISISVEEQEKEKIKKAVSKKL